MVNKKRGYSALLLVIGMVLSIFLVSCLVEDTSVLKDEILSDINRGHYAQIEEKFQKLKPGEQAEVRLKAEGAIPTITQRADDGLMPYTEAIHDLNAIKTILPADRQVVATNAIDHVTMIQNQKQTK